MFTLHGATLEQIHAHCKDLQRSRPVQVLLKDAGIRSISVGEDAFNKELFSRMGFKTLTEWRESRGIVDIPDYSHRVAYLNLLTGEFSSFESYVKARYRDFLVEWLRLADLSPEERKVQCEASNLILNFGLCTNFGTFWCYHLIPKLEMLQLELVKGFVGKRLELQNLYGELPFDTWTEYVSSGDKFLNGKRRKFVEKDLVRVTGELLEAGRR